MIIKRLAMDNFGIYAGLNTFEFTHTRPIVLIGGMNGRGKTTFLEAILLALYGPNSIAYKEGGYKSYGQYLRSYVNKGTWSQRSSVELEFILNESNSAVYLVRREWDALSNRTSDTITVQENSEYSDFLTKNWAMFVENILPSALSSFYFFDGEKIADLAVDNTNAQMKNSIRSMLGISVLDVIKNDLDRSLRRISKKTKGKESTEELQAVRQERDDLIYQLAKIDSEIEQQTVSIQQQKEKINRFHLQYEISGGYVVEQRQELMQQKSNLLAEMEQNENALIDIASGELPLLLVRDLIQQIKLQAEDEHNDLIMRQALSHLDDMLIEFAREHEAAYSASHDFVEFVKERTSAGATTSVYEMSDHALFQLNGLLEDLIDQSKRTTLFSLQRKSSLKKKLEEVDNYLSLDINEKKLSGILQSLKEQNAILVDFEVKLATLEQNRSSINASVVAKTIEFNHLTENYLTNIELLDDSDRLVKYSNIALRIIDEYTIELQKRKTSILGITITECYKKLANKKNLIQQIVMDPQTLDLSYLMENGIKVDKDSLSAGEKQLMVIAILWALAICSKKKLPVIIDTPLSRLDSMHRTSVVTTYFPHASDQTIILSTDTEIDHNYYELMKDSIGDKFTLSYCEETRSTTILKGYFQEK
ncbi:DNA sulfur modification protein DndD [Papillibacter cinnamivorans]|uniref:Nuclease SbcCD subunit C n=1 Tax=Papillibacter cinnamivorans DSM 12816 TaxID=1122930 RepID=A0A1W2AN72_9FIRM|nr:DNA sulfur modification protein DndD [Papillibacter cinnamivorans]SMC62145.1 DNA sulfur modification protein DndD [Papillibacter cinnamivorans DSM 12816]